MPTIYDNTDNQFSTGLIDSLDVSYRGDFCVGYFNLKGWKQVANYVEKWKGEGGNNCRLLIGMQRLPGFRMGKELMVTKLVIKLMI